MYISQLQYKMHRLKWIKHVNVKCKIKIRYSITSKILKKERHRAARKKNVH